MPPKVNKQKEDEALRLLEEQRKKEEDDRIRQEEMKKFTIITLPTGLPLTLTEYYMQEAMVSKDCVSFTKEYLTKVLEHSRSLKNFRPIDIQTLVDQVVYDLVFTQIQMGLSEKKSQVLLNIIFEVYKNLNPKFENEESKVNEYFNTYQQKPNSQQQQGRKKTVRVLIKNKESDWFLFNTEGQNSMKIFNSAELGQIIDYVRQSYFSHHQLVQYVQRNEQRPLEIILNFEIEKPSLDMPILNSASSYIPLDEQPKQTDQTLVEQSSEKIQQVEQVRPPTDEELLEPSVLALIRERLEKAKIQLDTKLDQRQNELNEKLQEMVTQLADKGKKGKK